jgi:trimeric autotransporter adhesin
MTQRRQTNLLTCALLIGPVLTAIGCGDDDPGKAVDSGAPDGSTSEAGTSGSDGSVDGAMRNPDGSTPDGGVLDGSAVDGSNPDAAARIVGDTWGFTSSKRLVLFERATGRLERAVNVAVPVNETVWGVDVRPADGSIIAVTSAGKLYTIDPQSGAMTPKSTLTADVADTSEAFTALAGTAYGVDFNPVPDRLRIVSNTGQNLRINVDTGAVTTDLALNPANTGVVAAAYTNSFAAACRTSLYVLDGVGRKLLLQNPPNDGKLTDLGSLGDAAIGAVHGFDIAIDSAGVSVALVSATAADGERVAELNLSTGALSSPRVVALNAGETLDSVFVLPPSTAPSQAVGELLATTATNKLISFNRGAPGKLCTSAPITGLGAGESVVGADVRPADGNLYALTNNGKLYTVAIATATAALKSTLTPATTLSGAEFAVGFNPVPDRLRVISDTGVNLRINVDDGVVTTDSAITQAAGTPGITAAAYTNSFAGARSTTLWAIDSTSDSLVLVGANPADAAACPNATNPNCGVSTVVQPLGITGDVTAINGFDIEATTGAALAALAIGDAASSTLYTIQPSGPTVSVAAGTIGGGERVRSLTFAATPALTAWVVTSDSKLISFAPNAPQTSLTNAALTGLQTDETLVGIDVRPLDGKLYGLGSTGRLYGLAPSGAATQVVALAPATGSAFTTLPISTYGFDFNPAADALRLVNRDEGNLRTLPSTRTAGSLGATFVDTALNPTGASVVAAGYTNNFVGTPNTTLYVIGGSVSTLYRQGGLAGEPSPNGGGLTSVGALGVNSAFDVGFDIAGGNNGLALAVLDQSNASTLFSINLSTGAATLLNGAATASASAIAGATGAVRGLALELK